MNLCDLLVSSPYQGINGNDGPAGPPGIPGCNGTKVGLFSSSGLLNFRSGSFVFRTSDHGVCVCVCFREIEEKTASLDFLVFKDLL